jgi:phage head maturation protease
MSTIDRTNLTAGGKAISAVPTASGDLIVTGYAAVWSGVDFENENFVREALDAKTISDYLDGQAPVLFHHMGSKGIGRCLDLEPDDHGLRFKALVHKQERTSPLYYIYDGVRRGIYRGVSLGGQFGRTMTAAGQRISRIRIAELSLTPAAMHPGTLATAAEVKAIGAGRVTVLDAAEHAAALLGLQLVALEARHAARSLR